ncbi:MAG: hypothetical protein ABI411_11655 [Tahibacter sp.]
MPTEALSLWGRLRGAFRRTPEHVPAIVDIEAVRRAELDLILGRDPDATEVSDVSVWGLALSGGGIRSATFGLGVLQALARNGLLHCFHYQSSVSGGGYIGAFLQGLIRRRGYPGAHAVLKSTLRDRAINPGAQGALDPQQPIQHLREYSNYLSPRKTPLSGDTLGMVGTYVRNVLLVQVQLCALLLASSLLPILLFRSVERGASSHATLSVSAAGLLCVLAAVMLGWVTMQANERPEGADERPRGNVVAAALSVIATLALASFLGAAGLCRLQALPQPLEAWSLVLAPPDTSLDIRLGVATGLLYFAVWVLWLVFDALLTHWQRGADDVEWRSPLQMHSLRFLAASVGGAVFSGLAVVATRHMLLPWAVADADLWHAMILGPPITLAAVTLTGVVHLGLAGPALSDLQREVWARVGGKTAGLVLVGIALALALTIYGPWLLLHVSQLAGEKWRALSGWAGIFAWVLTSGSGVLVAYSQRTGGPKQRSPLLDRLVRVAPAVFVLGLLVAISLGAQALLQVAGWDVRPSDAALSLNSYLSYLALSADQHFRAIGVVALIALAIWALFGLAVNVNEFSMNAFYRNRLVRCYLGASNAQRQPEPITNFDPHDDLLLADVVEVERDGACRPLFPLIGTALNLVAAKQLDWQDRKAASFFLTPGYCGYLPPPSRGSAPAVGDPTARAGATTRPGSTIDPLAASMTLGSAMSISGAAVSPNMGYHSSPAVTFLLTLFDARLGWWLANPNHRRPSKSDSAPFSGLWLLREMLGGTRDGGRYVYLSDGGHFENLGVYELVRRNCRFVVCVDAGADPQRNFADLGNAVQKCRIDFGADIRIDVSALQPGANGFAERSCAVGSIDYADGSRGVLLYLKPTLTGAEPTDVAHYARVHASFPHEPTSDQFFDEAQFESYRRLGDCVASAAIMPVLERAGADPASVPRAALNVRDSDLKERILVELRHQWLAPLSGIKERFAIHGKAMSRLFAKLRGTPALGILDAQIYPAWVDLVDAETPPGAREPMPPKERRTRLPAAEDFRCCFYFCQELMQLMESIYHDLELERSWAHPDNRGWLNAFRHWSWAPMFRIVWAASMPTYGARFVTFCEMRLDLPRLNDTVRVEELPRPTGSSWAHHCDELARQGVINHIEQDILLSRALGIDDTLPSNPRLFALRLKWRGVIARGGARLRDTTLGIAVVEGTSLRVLRVQDHLRKMGLGAEFMRRLIASVKVLDVEIRSGHYGAVGVYTNRDAQSLQNDLAKLLQQTRKHRQARNE